MKKFILITLLAMSTASANFPPTTLKGQSDTAKPTTFNTVVPYSQATPIGPSTSLIETGNENVLGNASFEHITPGFGWQATNVTVASSTTNVQDGKKSVQLTSTTTNWSFDFQSSAYSTSKVGQSAEGSLWVQATGTGATDIWLCEGSVVTPSSEICDKYDGSGLPRLMKVSTLFKSVGSGIRLMGNTSGTVIYADHAKFKNREYTFLNYNFISPTSYTPSAFNALGSPSSVDFKYERDGSNLKILFFFNAGTVTGGNAAFALPAGLIANISVGKVVGWFSSQGSLTSGALRIDAAAPSNVAFGAANWGVSATGTQIGTTSSVSGYLEVPILGWDANTPSVASPVDQTSNENINWVFKASPLVASDPVGTFATYSTAANTNTNTSCATPPTQTTASMQADGPRVFGRAYNVASTCAQPARLDVKVPTNLASTVARIFNSTGKQGPLQAGINSINATTMSGTSQYYYPLLGIFTLDATYNYSSGFTARYVDAEVNVTNAYFPFTFSKAANVATIPVFISKNTNAYATSFANLINNTTTDISGYTIRESNNSNFNTATGVYTVPLGEDGMYCMVATSNFTAPASTGVQTITYIKKNGSNYITSPSVNTTITSASTFVGSSANGCSRLKATDYLSVAVYQISGGNRTISSVDFYITKVGN